MYRQPRTIRSQKKKLMLLACSLFLLPYSSASVFAATPAPAATPAAPQAVPEARSYSIEDADTYLTQNKYKQAEEAYRSLLPDDSSGDSYAGLAVSLAKQGAPSKILEAEKILRKAKGNFADNPNVTAAAGYVSFVHSKSVASPAKRDQYLEASETLCKKSIQNNPDILIAQQTLGLVKIAQDDLEEAIEPLKKAVSLAENPVNLTLLAQALLRIDPKDKEAENYVDKALKLDKGYHPAHLQKSVILAQAGNQKMLLWNCTTFQINTAHLIGTLSKAISTENRAMVRQPLPHGVNRSGLTRIAPKHTNTWQSFTPCEATASSVSLRCMTRWKFCQTT